MRFDVLGPRLAMLDRVVARAPHQGRRHELPVSELESNEENQKLDSGNIPSCGPSCR